uniref:Uncharacterized protein n=1 Tax=Brassica oleracea TaxID=3712 RepID=A0A3P6DU31_BRAOL|nr:unnamed protein product [Brassica oleracea]
MRYKIKKLHYKGKRDKYQTVNGDVKLMHPGRTRTKEPAGGSSSSKSSKLS